MKNIEISTVTSTIIDICKKNNISGVELGKILNLKKSPLTDWKNGVSKPTLEHIIIICNHFSISPNEIFNYHFADFTQNLSNENKAELQNYAEYLQYKEEQEIAKKQAENIKETSPNYPTNTIPISEHIKEETRLDINEEDQEPKKELRILGYTAAGEPIDMPDDIYGLGDVIKVPTDTKADFALKVKGDSMEPRIPNGSLVYVKKQDTVDNGQIAIVSINNTVTCKIFKQKNDVIYLQSVNTTYDPIIIDNAAIDFQIIGKVIDQR